MKIWIYDVDSCYLENSPLFKVKIFMMPTNIKYYLKMFLFCSKGTKFVDNSSRGLNSVEIFLKSTKRKVQSHAVKNNAVSLK